MALGRVDGRVGDVGLVGVGVLVRWRVGGDELGAGGEVEVLEGRESLGSRERAARTDTVSTKAKIRDSKKANSPSAHLSELVSELLSDKRHDAASLVDRSGRKGGADGEESVHSVAHLADLMKPESKKQRESAWARPTETRSETRGKRDVPARTGSSGYGTAAFG